ncbi:MAG: LytTR family transcriptional regulator DNA-binding domain-containing protein, partial [Sphingobacterium sp.]
AKVWLDKQSTLNQEAVELNTATGKSRINIIQIGFIQVAQHDRRDKEIHLLDGRTVLAKNISMEELLQRLPANEFAQVNRKTVVSLAQISAYTSQMVICKSLDGKGPMHFPLTASYKTDFINKFSTQYNF